MNLYFIALVAPDHINADVLKWKYRMKERYQCVVALRSPAHITLVPPFRMNDKDEEKLSRSLAEFSAGQKKFVLRLADFSSFIPRVIFVAVVQNEVLTTLKNELVAYLLAINKYPVKKEAGVFHPHVTIANRDLQKQAFYEAWEYFKEKKYKAEWPVQDISLLKYNNQKWDVAGTFPFSSSSRQ